MVGGERRGEKSFARTNARLFARTDEESFAPTLHHPNTAFKNIINIIPPNNENVARFS